MDYDVLFCRWLHQRLHTKKERLVIMKRFLGIGKIVVILALCFSLFAMSFQNEASASASKKVFSHSLSIDEVDFDLSKPLGEDIMIFGTVLTYIVIILLAIVLLIKIIRN